MSLWGKLSLLGTKETHPEHLNRKLILGNRIAALSGMLVVCIAFLYVNFFPQFITYLLGGVLCFLFLLFNYWGKTKFSRVFFMLAIPAFIAVGDMFVPEAVRATQKMAILSSITIPLVLFGVTEKKPMILGLIWTVKCFVLVDFIHFDLGQSPSADWLMQNLKLMEYLGALVSFSVFIATFIYLQKLNLLAEDRLHDLLDQSNRQKNEIVEQKKQLEEVNRTLRIKALTAQLNPHFLYNSLNSIQHFLTINDKTSSINYLSKFGRLIRQFIEYADKGVIPLSEELTLLKYYLELESLRFGSMFQYELEVEEDLLLYNIHVPLLLIQIHAENAILHGLMNKQEGERKLMIHFRREGECMRCVIEDNGIGRKASTKLKQKRRDSHPSRGIEISTRRLELMYADSSCNQLITITDLYSENDQPAGTRVEVKIPFEVI